MKNLSELVDIYNRINAKNEEWKLSDFKKSTKAIEELIEDAVLGREPRLNRDKHQYRIPQKTIKEMIKILRSPKVIEEMKRCKSFDEIFTIVYVSRIKNFGPLAVYDTSLRLGVIFGHYPSVIYLHRGALEGAIELLGQDELKRCLKYYCDNPNYPYIGVDILPEPLNKMEPFHIENFLCIFKDKL